MPYSDHPAFSLPAESKTIWRYLSFSQLLSILSTETLYFSRADVLNDPFEGVLPQANIKATDESIGDISRPEVGEIVRKGGEKSVTWSEPNLRTKLAVYRRISFLNCWHMMPHESIAMWDANLEGGNGIAIKSSVGALKDVLDTTTDNEIYIGVVNYINYREETIPEENILYPFAFKREGFRHESELRAVITKPPVDGYPELEGKIPGQTVPLDWDGQETGLAVDIDAKRLIEEIRLHPSAEPWELPKLEELVDRFGCDIPVDHSELALQPKYLDQE